MIKRFLDLFFSSALVVIMSPIFLMISVIIKLTSKGPVLFRQRRVGKDNREFMIYKFRSMRTDTPNVATHLLTNPETFITPIGRFLRKSSMDELPQLFNIFKGEMSFVGPRPALYNQHDLNELRTKAGIHKLVPGLTGWAQINGRDDIQLDTKVELDKYYLNNQTLWLDFKIIFKTAFKVLKREGIVEGNKSMMTGGR